MVRHITGAPQANLHVQNQWSYYSLFAQIIYESIIDLLFFYKGFLIHQFTCACNLHVIENILCVVSVAGPTLFIFISLGLEMSEIYKGRFPLV